MLQEINSYATSPIFKSVHFPDLQIFVETFCTNLESSVWIRHVGVPSRNTNMATVKYCKHQELALAI